MLLKGFAVHEIFIAMDKKPENFKYSIQQKRKFFFNEIRSIKKCS
jgi:hypothetical protein